MRPAPGIVGLAQLHRGSPPPVGGEATAHRLARGLRSLPSVHVAAPGPHEVAEEHRCRGLRAENDGSAHADARPGADAEDEVRAAARRRGLGLHQRLEVAPLGESEADVPGRPLHARRPQRLARAQARRPPRARPSDHPVALDPHRGEEGRGARAEDHLDALLALRSHELDRDVLEPAGREHELDRAPQLLAVERTARDEADEGEEPLRLLRLHPHRADELLRRAEAPPRRRGGPGRGGRPASISGTAGCGRRTPSPARPRSWRCPGPSG